MEEVVDLCASSDDDAPPPMPPMQRQHTTPTQDLCSSSDDEAAAPPPPRPVDDDDDDDEDFMSFFTSRRGPAPPPRPPPAAPPRRPPPPARRPAVVDVDLTASPAPARKRAREAPPAPPPAPRRTAPAPAAPWTAPPPPQPALPQTVTARASAGFTSRWPDASGAFAPPQAVEDAPPATAFRRALRQAASVEFYGGARPLRHCLCVIDARDGRDAAKAAHERLAQALDGDGAMCVCALVCAVDRPEWSDVVLRLERRLPDQLKTRLIWVQGRDQSGAKAQKAVAVWARTYMRRFEKSRGKNNDDPLEFLHGQCVDDVKRWKGPRPTKHIDAWAPALQTLMGASAGAEAVAGAFPSYARLVDVLGSEGPEAVARVPKKTAKGNHTVGPAAAARLRSVLTSTNPGFVGS